MGAGTEEVSDSESRHVGDIFGGSLLIRSREGGGVNPNLAQA